MNIISHTRRMHLAGILVATTLTVAGQAATLTNRLKELTLEELMAVDVGTVTAASRREEAVDKAPGTVLVIDRRQIERRGYQTLGDVLRDLPGIDLIPYYFSEIGTQVAIRGIAGNNKIVVLLNGMRVNPPGGEYYPLRTDFSVLDAEKIEVVYGPGSTLHGQDAIAAVINIITINPDARLSEVSMAGGPYETRQAWGTFADAIGPDDQVKVLGHVYYFRSELTDLQDDYPDWWAPYRDEAAPRGAGSPPDRLDEGLNVVLRVAGENNSMQVFHRQSRRNSAEGFSTILGYTPEARWEDVSTVVEGKNTLPLSDRVRLESTLAYSRYEIDPDSRYVFPADDTRWFDDDFKYGLGSGASVEETLRFALAPGLDLLAGGMAAAYEITPKSTVPGRADPKRDIRTQAGTFVYLLDPSDPSTRHEIPRAETSSYETYAGYLEAAWQCRPAWKVISGVRGTYDTRFDDTPITPRFALIHTLNTIATLKYTFTRAYVAPAPYFSNAPFDNGTVLNTANPELEPEKAYSHEVSLHLATAQASGGISAYAGRQENRFLIADSTRPQTILNEKVYLEDGSTRVLGHTVNSGASENRGLDLYGELHWRNFSPWLSYSYVWFEDSSPGADGDLPGLSTHMGRLGVTWAPQDRLLITPSLYIRSTPEGVQTDTLASELHMPWAVNLHVLYRLSPRADVFLNAQNITDHRYALSGITGEAVPQETVHGLAGIKVRF